MLTYVYAFERSCVNNLSLKLFYPFVLSFHASYSSLHSPFHVCIQVNVANYPIERIARTDSIFDDEDFGDLFSFITYHKVQHVVHLFQVCQSV